MDLAKMEVEMWGMLFCDDDVFNCDVFVLNVNGENIVLW